MTNAFLQNQIPRHVAIVMDGNGRWAQERGLPTIAGHHAGAKVVRAVVEGAHALGISYLTLYTFSTENWGRDPVWVEEMMDLLRFYLQEEAETLLENGVRLKVIGDVSRFPEDLQDLMQQLQRRSQKNSGLTLLIALGYGGRDEIVRAAGALLEKVQKAEWRPQDVTVDSFSSLLDTAGIPDPDLLIRTGGEQRVSNFLLWQLAYAELVFLDVYWPDFTPQLFEKALEAYLKRERRYGVFSDSSADNA